uniref:Alpha-taxilin n=1 Tax=Hydra vulgaris TaxID=6087 RepID=T2MGG6_HYDVU
MESPTINSQNGMLISEITEHDSLTEDTAENIQENGVNEGLNGNRKSRPSPESIAMDRGIQNIARKAHKNSKGDDKKLVDLLVHVFDSLDTPEKKMEALARKYVQLAADHKSTEQQVEEIETKHLKVKKERDHLQSEYNKLMIAKGKLESLCRELQKHNKQIKEETQRRAEEEERKRKELSQKFQSTISDITSQMADNHKRNQQLKQDNNDLAQKLKGLVEQYEVREQHIEKVLKAKQLELQLCEAKLQQQNLVVQEEMESHLKEKHSVLEESLNYKKKCEELLQQEAELRAQLSLYTEKFEEFQSTLTKSNEVFATFKKDMDTMTKTIRKLEKESNMWRSRWENTNHSLLQMVEERTQNHTTITKMKSKMEKLEKLCRALQSERKTLSKQLENGKDETEASSSPEPTLDISDPHVSSTTPSPDLLQQKTNSVDAIETGKQLYNESTCHEPTIDENQPENNDKAVLK